MSNQPFADFYEIMVTKDRERLLRYLEKSFPDDKNFHIFSQLADFTIDLSIATLPTSLIVCERDKEFVNELLTSRLSNHDCAARSNAIHISEKLDFLEHTCSPARLSAIQQLTLSTRIRSEPASDGVAVVVMARDEGIYLLEWLAHYRLLGAEKIFVYTNDNQDLSDLLLLSLSEKGYITLINNSFQSGVNPQRKAYQHAVLLLRDLKIYRWALFVDADEFLNFKPNSKGQLRKFILELNEFSENAEFGGVLFPWNWRFTDRSFSRNEHNVWGAYEHSAMHKTVKALVNLRQTLAMCEVHVPTVHEHMSFIDGQLRLVNRKDVWNGIENYESGPVIEHFWSKSFLEFTVKKNRGDTLALEGKQFLRDFEQFFSWTARLGDQNISPLSLTWQQMIQEEISNLLTDDKISESYSLVTKAYTNKCAQLFEDNALREIYKQFLACVPPSMS